ncbi:MAG TPA: metalloregulator ArsR/SmtB family transcription factor [Spirochaetales bacterium]|nr:metalloregulator ArsR/SmtB family transcription factor [Spirochaetales bacterium]
METFQQNVKYLLDFCFQTLQLIGMEARTIQQNMLMADVFKALAHPVRIAILDMLRTRPWCVCELAGELNISKSVASKHLSQLKAAGLIAVEKRGTLVEYRLIAPCILDMAACTERTILENKRKELERLTTTTTTT